MEGCLFELVHNMKLGKQSKQCEICDAVREQIKQGPMRDLLTLPKPKKNKNKRGEEVPLEKPANVRQHHQIFEVDQEKKTTPQGSRIKFYTVLHTLPALRGRRDRIQSFLTTRRHTRSSTSFLCAVYGAQIRL